MGTDTFDKFHALIISVQARKAQNDGKPPLKHTEGSVASSNPAHMAFSTAVLSNFPSQKTNKTLGDGDKLHFRL